MNETDHQAAISRYLTDIKELYYRGDATEHSYRPALQQLIHDLFPEYIAINERKRVDVGAPDLVIFKRDENPEQAKLIPDVPLGFVEAKDIVAGILDRAEHQEQIKRYMELGNVVHTDGLEFRFYFDKELVKTLSIAHVNDSRYIVDNPADNEDLAYYLKETITRTAQTVRTAKSLALLMADRARPIRRTIRVALEQDIEASKHTTLTDQYDAFRETLIHDLSTENFADIYAETIAYGLFAARYNDDTTDDFSLREAAEKVPQTNPFLRQFFLQIAAYEKDARLDWVLNNFAELFRHANVHKIMANYGKTTGMNHDPVTHFYETFLGEYDSKRRKARGVYYTPLPVVQHIVRAVDQVLKDEFGLADGLADDSTVEHTYSVNPYKKGRGTGGKEYFTKTDAIPRVQILDPATGTGTFLNETIKLIAERKKHLGSSWSSYVESNLLPRMHGFELLMAAYSMAHMRLSLTLAESGYTPSSEHPRIGVYLTNTLEEPAQEEPPLLAMLGMGRALTEEATAADRVKRDLPIMVVMGNPPYSVSSSNKSKYIDGLMADYKKDLNEKNIQPLSDDYIKFIRYAESMIEKTGTGIVAMITNNSYIDGIIHRQMRKHLLETFDSIRVIDLHGNTKKKEAAPDGSLDENVFDIQQGVSIVIMTKTGGKQADKLAKVTFSELYGKRQRKYTALAENVTPETITPKHPSYYIVKKDDRLEEEYSQFIALRNLMPLSGSGVQTKRDEFFISQERAELLDHTSRILGKQIGNISANDVARFNITDSSSYPFIKRVRSAQYDEKFISKSSYKVFDDQYIYYDKNVVGRNSYDIMQHMLNKNVALTIMRKPVVKADTVSSYMVTTGITDINYYGFQSYSFPLYIYSYDGSVSPNLDNDEIRNLLANLGPYQYHATSQDTEDSDTITPLDIFDYVYGLFYSPVYRERYKEQLKNDFPRVPPPKDRVEFEKYRNTGKRLRELHLMHNAQPYDAPLTGEGNGLVEKISYQDGNIYINNTQHFPGVPEMAWNFYIGSYQPAQKWLKDRKGRELSWHDVEHYQKIIAILLETDRIMKDAG